MRATTRFLAIITFFSAFSIVSASADESDSAPLRRRLDAISSNAPAGLRPGSLDGIRYLLDTADRIDNRFSGPATEWRRKADELLDVAERGVDPYEAQGGKILNRAYRSPISERLQGYAVYLPPNYDPSRSYPLMVMLHGGSSNGNLFLGVTLGNNMSWLTYDEHLYDIYSPRWTPDWIIVAPDGYGQVLWRWMGEQDVLDVMDDVQRNYNVDSERITLCGLSNGGVGAHNIGMRHASRFASVIAMAGAPSWLQYTGGRPRSDERSIMQALSGMELLENSRNTDYRYYHGRVDPGPMRPAYIDALDRRVAELGVPARGTWFDAGHDLLYIVHRHGAIYNQLANVRRKSRPSDVTVMTGDYRAAKQHWVTVTRMDAYPQISRVRAVVEGSDVRVETSNVRAFSLDLREMPLAEGESAKVIIDGHTAYDGARASLGHVIHLVRGEGGWRTGFPEDGDGLVKRPGLSGPIMDAYYDRMIHVYGTQAPDDVASLKRTAERAAKGWPLWLWSVAQRVVADTDVTPEMMESATLVLYGNASNNSLLARMDANLPIRADADALSVGTVRYEGSDVGARFIYPNPLSPERYVIVQTGVTPEAVAAGNNLPDFVPDFIVYDRSSTRARQRLISGGNAPLASGFFDSSWRFTGQFAENQGGDDGPSLALATSPSLDALGRPLTTTLAVPAAPPVPAPPTSYLAPQSDPAGRAARLLTKRVATFFNYRAAIAGGEWRRDEAAMWKVRRERECLADLERLGVPARAAGIESEIVPVPVEITGPVSGVTFHSVHGAARPVVVACEMAARLVDVARIASRHGVRSIDVMSSYRDRPRTSFHTLGLALDLSAFRTASGKLSVARDFVVTPNDTTCSGEAPADEKARVLRAIACDLSASGRFSSVLTPNYNGGHRDHFHLDARPDDDRIYLR